MDSIGAIVVDKLGLVAVGLAVLIAVMIAVKLLIVKPLRKRRAEREELELKRKIAEKAARQIPDILAEDAERLTDSGVFSVLEMIDALVSAGNLAEAEKWALNAIHHHPHRTDVPVKLAEVYYEAGRKSAFVAVARSLSDKRDKMPKSAWEKLARMGNELAPEEPVFAAESGRQKRDDDSVTIH